MTQGGEVKSLYLWSLVVQFERSFNMPFIVELCQRY